MNESPLDKTDWLAIAILVMVFFCLGVALGYEHGRNNAVKEIVGALHDEGLISDAKFAEWVH